MSDESNINPPDVDVPDAHAPIAGFDPPDETEQPGDIGRSSRSGNTGPGFGRAILVTLLATIPLLTVLYLGNQLLDLPFPPFDLYSRLGLTGFSPWIALNNALIGTTAINADDLIRRTLQAQWILGATLFFLLALVVGLIFYAFVRWRERPPRLIGGLIAGLLLSILLIYVNLTSANSGPPAMPAAAWLAGACMIWGIAVSYAFGRLMRITDGDSPETPVPDGMDRRQFLLQFGAGAAAVAAISGAAATAIAPGKDATQLQRTLPMISPEMLEAQRELFGDFRRFAIVRNGQAADAGSNVLALGAEYPDRNYVSIWIGGQSPIIVYENLRSALAAYSTEENPAGAYWLDD